MGGYRLVVEMDGGRSWGMEYDTLEEARSDMGRIENNIPRVQAIRLPRQPVISKCVEVHDVVVKTDHVSSVFINGCRDMHTE